MSASLKDQIARCDREIEECDRYAGECRAYLVVLGRMDWVREREMLLEKAHQQPDRAP